MNRRDFLKIVGLSVAALAAVLAKTVQPRDTVVLANGTDPVQEWHEVEHPHGLGKLWQVPEMFYLLLEQCPKYGLCPSWRRGVNGWPIGLSDHDTDECNRRIALGLDSRGDKVLYVDGVPAMKYRIAVRPMTYCGVPVTGLRASHVWIARPK